MHVFVKRLLKDSSEKNHCETCQIKKTYILEAEAVSLHGICELEIKNEMPIVWSLIYNWIRHITKVIWIWNKT